MVKEGLERCKQKLIRVFWCECIRPESLTQENKDSIRTWSRNHLCYNTAKNLAAFCLHLHKRNDPELKWTKLFDKRIVKVA